MGDVGLTKRIWLLLLREGGRWSELEVSDALRGDRKIVLNALRSMANGNSLSRFEREGKGARVQYGVTPSCRIANGVTIAEILAADLMPFIGKDAKL